MVVVDELPGDSVAALLDEIIDGGDDLQDVLDNAAREVVAAGGEKELKEGEEEELEWLSNKDAFPTLETVAPAQAGTEAARPRRPEAAGSPPPALPPRSQAPEKAERRCRHCGMDETPLWRKGPEGRGTLCNACGVRYQAGRLVPEYRPLNSPTFSPELHSNRHSHVLDLVRRREESAKASPPPPPATE